MTNKQSEVVGEFTRMFGSHANFNISHRDGLLSQKMVEQHLIARGKVVLIPSDQTSRFDLAFLDTNANTVRVQVKTGRIVDNCLVFDSSSRNYQNGKRIHRSYIGEVEVFGVYCHKNQKSYLFPISYCGKQVSKFSMDESSGKKCLPASWFEIHV